jgi:hypothetical protein
MRPTDYQQRNRSVRTTRETRRLAGAELADATTQIVQLEKLGARLSDRSRSTA